LLQYIIIIIKYSAKVVKEKALTTTRTLDVNNNNKDK